MSFHSVALPLILAAAPAGATSDRAIAFNIPAQNMATSLLAQALSTRHVTVVALHPGWVRTDMGGQNAALSVEESAAGLLHVIDRLTPDDSGYFLDWQGQSLPW